MAESRNPFRGPYSFEEEHAPLFFGREREAQHLTAMIVSERVVLFYAQSGAGKTSLVNAKLVPELKRKGFQVFPQVRVGDKLPPGAAPRNVYVYNALKRLDGSHPPDESLDGFLRTGLAGRSEDSPPRVLILDQFEEILTTHPERWPEREGFFLQLRQALQDDPSLSVVLVLREDHLAGLDRYAPLLGGHRRARFRLERLRREQAIAAIRKPAEVAGRPFEPDVAERLAEDLCQLHVAGQKATVAGELVEPVQLQAVCFQLWENLRNRPGETITLQDRKKFGDVDRALESFYESAVRDAAHKSGVPEARIRQWCGATLITPTRIRSQVSREAEHTGGLLNTAIDELVDAHLIRPEEARGGVWYELAHDRLIGPILRSNARVAPEEMRQLTADVETWQNEDRDPSFLYRGVRLERALEWEKEQGTIGAPEREFLAASQALETKIARRMRFVVAAVAAPLLLAATLFAFKFWQESRISTSRELALAARDKLEEDPELGLLLALEAVERSSAPEAEWALHEVLLTVPVGGPMKALSIFPDSAGALAFSRDGARFASVGAGGVQVWQTAGSAKPLTLKGFSAIVTSLAFSPKDNGLAIGDVDGKILIADSRSGRLLRVLDAAAAVNALAFSPDGTRLAAATDDPLVAVWDVASGKRVMELAGHTYTVWDVAFSRDGRYLATAGEDGAVILRDASTGKETQRLRGSDYVLGIDFGPDGRLAAATGDEVRVWDLSTGLFQILRGHKQGVWDVAFSPNGEYLATASRDGSARLWNGNSAQEVVSLSPKGDEAVRVAFDPRTGTLATTSRASEGREGWVTIWRTFLRGIGQTLPVSQLPISGVAFSPDGKQFVTADGQGRAILWEAPARQLKKLVDLDAPIQSLAFNGQLLVLGGGAGPNAVHIWDVAKDRELGTLPVPVWGVALSPDERRVLTVGDGGAARVWDIASRKEPVLTLSGHEGLVRGAAFSPDGQWIATCGDDKTLVWDAETGSKIETPLLEAPCRAVAFSPDSRRLAIAGEAGKTTIRGTKQWKKRFTLEGHEAAVADVAFDPQGERLATAGEDRTARVWDAETGKLLFTLAGYTDPVSKVAFSPSGEWLATTSNDGSVRLEPLDVETLKRFARERLAGRVLTKEEQQNYLHK